MKTIDPAVVSSVPARIASHYPFMPLGLEDGVLQVALPESSGDELLDELRVILRREVRAVRWPLGEIEQAIKTHYGIGADTLESMSAQGAAPAAEPAKEARHHLEAEQDASVIRFVNQMLLEAYQSRATDIHLEPYENDLRVRYRIDGVLYEARCSESLKRFQAAVISRIKIMADLSIAEKRLPQDGRIVVRVDGRDMDLRVSTLPTPFGESVEIRLLTSQQLLDLSALGFAPGDLERLQAYLRRPHGILFLTGPTGSGKTTTLYAFLKQINQTDRKIITLEDPIEYQMRGITQVQVQPRIGLTFASGLRSMLRHDPDVMMVGEVRDRETADIAIRVALTGHLVFSTLHTNDAPGAVTRLDDIGVEPYLISSSVLCVVAQRLVRVICADCKVPGRLSAQQRREFGLVEGRVPVTVYSGKGCEACNGTGYRGRTVIYEILPVTPGIQERVVARAPANVIRDQALFEGMIPLRQCGWMKVMAGITTADEVLRATLQEALPPC